MGLQGKHKEQMSIAAKLLTDCTLDKARKLVYDPTSPNLCTVHVAYHTPVT